MTDLTSFFQYIIIRVSSLIEAYYWFEDIFSEQVHVIIEQIHHLTYGGLVVRLDLHKAKDVQCKLSDQCKIVLRTSRW